MEDWGYKAKKGDGVSEIIIKEKRNIWVGLCESLWKECGKISPAHDIYR